MKKQTIAVDIDEVLSPLHKLVFAHHNDVYGTNYPLDSPEGKYFLSDYTGDPYDVTMDKLNKFIKTEAFQNVKPLRDAISTIQYLKSKYNLIVVTARQDFYYDMTHKWLEQAFPATFSSVHFTDYAGGTLLKIPKSKACIDNGAEYLIDDNLGNAFECAEAGINVLLFGDYPWNKTKELPAGIVRVRDWRAVKEYFDKVRT